MKKKQTPEFITASKILQVFLAASFGVIGTIGVIAFGAGIPIKDNWDIANWATLVVEIGIGTSIAAAILIYSNHQQHKFNKQQEEIAELVKQTKLISTSLEQKNRDAEKHRQEQYEFAIHRARSYLSSLHSIISILKDYDLDPNFPPEYDKKFDSLYEQKKEMVRQLEYVVNQSDSVIEQRHLSRITDIIELTRIHPDVVSMDHGYHLDTSHCEGIMSQIEELLKIMPNPPV